MNGGSTLFLGCCTPRTYATPSAYESVLLCAFYVVCEYALAYAFHVTTMHLSTSPADPALACACRTKQFSHSYYPCYYRLA